MEIIENIIKWFNNNSGFTSVVIFILSVFIMWVSGLFKFLSNKPILKIELVEMKPTFGCVFDLNKKQNGFPVNKSSFVIYLHITNIGQKPCSIERIKLGYIKSDLQYKFLSKLKRQWIPEIVCKDDFKIKFNDSDRVLVLPFLKQKNLSIKNSSDTYLTVGKSVKGMVYFEQNESFGNWLPRYNKDNKTTNVKIEISDSFNNKYYKVFDIELVEPNFALEINPFFGQTEKEYFQEYFKKTETSDT